MVGGTKIQYWYIFIHFFYWILALF